jgi:hypothetical protein
MTSESFPNERRSRERGVADKWRDAQHNAWRVEGFKMQVAQEARARRDAKNLKLAVVVGMTIGATFGVAGLVISLFG